METYPCECKLVYASQKILDKHMKSKLHNCRMKYPADENNMTHCESCNVDIDVTRYENHLKTIRHQERSGIPVNKMHCKICGKTINEHKYEEHLKAKSHQKKMNLKLYKQYLREQLYESKKDLSNCCKECKHVNIQDSHFNKEFTMCNYCYEVSINGTKQCYCCKQIKPTKIFERPQLYFCKECVNLKKQNKKVLYNN
jgi:hypothetical protein